MTGKRVMYQVPWTEMSFMSSHVCRWGEFATRDTRDHVGSSAVASNSLSRRAEAGSTGAVAIPAPPVEVLERHLAAHVVPEHDALLFHLASG